MAHWSENAAKEAKESMSDLPAEAVSHGCYRFNVLSYAEIIEEPDFESTFEIVEEPEYESGFEVIEGETGE